MAERQTVNVRRPVKDSRPRAAVLGADDASLQSSATEALSSLGFEVAVADDASLVLETARTTDPELILLDAALGGRSGMKILQQLREEKHEAPVLLLVTEDDRPPADEGLNLAVADYIYKPVNVRELAQRIDYVLAGVQQRRRRRATMEALREQTRTVSAAIRGTNDPQSMAGSVTRGLGRAFKADFAFLWVFEDKRVPALTSQWRRDSSALASRPKSIDPYADSARRLAGDLWEGASALSVQGDAVAVALRNSAELSRLDETLGATAVAGVPVGEGEGVFGLIWLVSTTRQYPWSPSEISMIQHVASNLAHGLIQGNLITVQQQVLKRLQQLDKAKSDFVATVNHELRTPLTSITGYLDMVQSGEGGEIPATASRMLEIVVRNSVRLQGLIEDVLTLSRMDSEQSLPEMAAVDVGGLLKTVIASLSPIASGAKVELTLGPVRDNAVVEGNATQLEQVFINVVSNAIKFTPAGGKVQVAVGHGFSDAGSPMVTVEVSDNGIGIPGEDLPRLFNRFFRASNATAAAVPGTGLGLAIVQAVVEQHGGEVTVKSTEGSGTTMTIHLPIRVG